MRVAALPRNLVRPEWLSEGSADAAWVHAYLHRVEGDLGNAGYWYRQAGQPVAKDSLEAEWERIISSLLGSGKA